MKHLDLAYRIFWVAVVAMLIDYLLFQYMVHTAYKIIIGGTTNG